MEKRVRGEEDFKSQRPGDSENVFGEVARLLFSGGQLDPEI